MQHSAQKRGEVGADDAATKLGRRPTDPLEGCGQVCHQLVYVIGSTIREFPFGKGPDPLVGIEFGSVGREVLDSQSRVPTAERVKRPSLVSPGIVQQGNDGSTKLAQEVTEELADFQVPDVVEVEVA